MFRSTKIFTKYLEMENISFQITENGIENHDVVKLHYDMDKMPHGDAYIALEESCAKLYIFSIASVTDDKRITMLNLLNNFNRSLLWACFYINQNNQICSSSYIPFSEYNFGKLCFNVLYTLISVTDKCYPEIMKILW